MVTDLMPATRPANVTTPEAGALTSEPGRAARSTPQCPEYPAVGAKSATAGPSTGGTVKHTTRRKLNSTMAPYEVVVTL
jgi:hypothetical protein